MNFSEEDVTLDDIYVSLTKEAASTNMSNNFTYSFDKPSSSSEKDRNWKLLSSTISQKLSEINQGMKSFVSLKTRSEPGLIGIPERIFSSLKYTCEFSIPKSLINGEVLLAKLQVVDSYKPAEEILNKNEKTILKGVSDFISLSVDKEETEFSSTIKFQFIDNSFRHEKRYFSLKVSFFESQNVSSPLFVILSPPFKVYARRPQNAENEKEIKSTNKKRKIEEVPIEPKMKRINSSSFFKFENTLDMLSKQFEGLDEVEKINAYDSIKKRFPNLNQPKLTNVKEEDDVFGLTDPDDSLIDFQSFFN